MKSRKRYITLIEVLIAMSLVSILLTSLFGVYSYLYQIHNEINRQATANTRLLFAQYRLASILPKTEEIITIDKKKTALPFIITEQISQYNEGKNLIFVFDNGVDGDPDFSTELLARLYLNSKGELILITWPWRLDPNLGPVPSRKEIILEGISELDFAVYSPPPPPTEIEERGAGIWHSLWPTEAPIVEEEDKEEKITPLPSILKILLTFKPKASEEPLTLTFSYVLPGSSNHIIYTQ